MYENLINILNVANNINQNDNLETIQKKFINIIDTQTNSNLYRLMIYAIDDKLINMFGYLWYTYLLEKQYFKTDIGGNKFYEYIKEYIDKKDYILLYACALILKNGFKGCYNIWPENIYNEIIGILHIASPAVLNTYSPYKPHIKYNQLISWWWFILPIIILVIFSQIVNIIVFILANNILKGVA